MLLVDSVAEMAFVSAHVPLNLLELLHKVSQNLFCYLNDSFQSMKLNLSHNGIQGQNFVQAGLLYCQVANETAIC